jgi:hypothetical protein
MDVQMDEEAACLRRSRLLGSALCRSQDWIAYLVAGHGTAAAS